MLLLLMLVAYIWLCFLWPPLILITFIFLGLAWWISQVSDSGERFNPLMKTPDEEEPEDLLEYLRKST